jgi:hypothetical protein
VPATRAEDFDFNGRGESHSNEIASGAECARATSGARDTHREELIPLKKIVAVVERMLGAESAWHWT